MLSHRVAACAMDYFSNFSSGDIYVKHRKRLDEIRPYIDEALKIYNSKSSSDWSEFSYLLTTPFGFLEVPLSGKESRRDFFIKQNKKSKRQGVRDFEGWEHLPRGRCKASVRHDLLYTAHRGTIGTLLPIIYNHKTLLAGKPKPGPSRVGCSKRKCRS